MKDHLMKGDLTCDDIVNAMSGHTIVHEAIILNRKDMFKLCVVYGGKSKSYTANWNTPDMFGATPLMKASGLGRIYYVE
jgi:ankyrin repeat protein